MYDLILHLISPLTLVGGVSRGVSLSGAVLVSTLTATTRGCRLISFNIHNHALHMHMSTYTIMYYSRVSHMIGPTPQLDLQL